MICKKLSVSDLDHSTYLKWHTRLRFLNEYHHLPGQSTVFAREAEQAGKEQGNHKRRNGSFNSYFLYGFVTSDVARSGLRRAALHNNK